MIQIQTKKSKTQVRTKRVNTGEGGMGGFKQTEQFTSKKSKSSVLTKTKTDVTQQGLETCEMKCHGCSLATSRFPSNQGEGIDPQLPQASRPNHLSAAL